MTERNRTYQNERVSIHSDVQCGSTNRQTSFLGRGNAKIKLPFSGHIANKFRRPTILQMNIEGLTATLLHHLAMQSEVPLSYYRRPTSLMQRSWYFQTTNWVFFKLEAWPCHVCPRATEIHAFGPISTDIGDRVIVCGR